MSSTPRPPARRCWTPRIPLFSPAPIHNPATYGWNGEPLRRSGDSDTGKSHRPEIVNRSGMGGVLHPDYNEVIFTS